MAQKRIAVLLCGSGYLDGSEIRESVGTLWALSQHDVKVQCFAPDAPQTDVINHMTVQPANETRNMMIEAARIARGEILPLPELEVSEFDALVIPGGFGAAKNLCNFAMKGSQGSVRPDVAATLQAFLSAGKPIGAICIAPAAVALTFKGKGLELTVGGPSEAVGEIEKLGHKHFVTKANEFHADANHKIATTGAYMFDKAPLHEVFTGIQKVVNQVVKWS